MRTYYALLLLSILEMVAAQTARVLIFSATTGYRHDSIPTAIEALKNAGPSHNVTFDNTEDSAAFSDSNLALYDAVLFLMVTDISPNDILNPEQQSALQNYFNKGGNFVGIHSASDCLHDVTFYGKELGAYFKSHPTISQATFLNDIEPTHPTVSMIPAQWTYTEEVYNFKSDPRSVGANVVLTVAQPDGDAYASIQGSPHPIAWYQERGAGVSSDASLVGRSFYTALGHLNSTWQDTTFMGHVMAGVTWALGSNTTKAFSNSGLVGNGVSQAAGASQNPISSTTGSSTQATSTSTSGSARRADADAATAAGMMAAVAAAGVAASLSGFY